MRLRTRGASGRVASHQQPDEENPAADTSRAVLVSHVSPFFREKIIDYLLKASARLQEDFSRGGRATSLLLQQVMNPNVFLLFCAIISPQAHHYAKYSSFQNQYDVSRVFLVDVA
jgi:hypothetical protein